MGKWTVNKSCIILNQASLNNSPIRSEMKSKLKKSSVRMRIIKSRNLKMTYPAPISKIQKAWTKYKN